MNAREQQDRDRSWLLDTFDAPALRQMAEDLERPLPLGRDPANAWLTANALARAMADR